jgi:flagellin-specific chaperone FliS
MSLELRAEKIQRVLDILAELQKRLDANPLDATANQRYKEYSKQLELLKSS